MHKVTWVLQIVFAVYFVAIGVMHFIVPEGLPEAMEWMYDLPTWMHYGAGVAEILGGLGLVLPGLTRVRPELTVLAASGLALVMVLAAGWHAPRGEIQNLSLNLVMAAILLAIAYVRWRLHPLTARDD